MNREIEAELRQVFAQRATGVSSEAVARLRQVDYRPRTSRLSSPLKVSALTGAATAGTIASIVILGGAQPAFAGWSPTPRSAPGAPDTTVAANCQDRLDALPAVPGSAVPGPGGSSGWNAAVTDVRGPFSVVIFQNGEANATCFSGPSFTIVSRHSADGDSVTASGGNGGRPAGKGTTSGEGTTSTEVGGTGSGEIEQTSVSHLSLSGEGAYTLVEGQVEPGVTHVTLVWNSGGNVDATTGDGWFVAWWPGSQDVTSALITTAAGTTTQNLTMPSPAGAGPGESASSGAGGSGSLPTGGSGSGPISATP
jgi:hypothetical protein